MGAALAEARRLFRPISWRGATPDPKDVDCLLFDRTRRVTSFDGTEIAYDVYGRRGPWVALVPGFSCPDSFWRYMLPDLAEDFRVIVWDLRGLGLSGTPRPPGYRARNLSSEDFSISANARDLVAVLDAERVTVAALVGHSMGGQTILEAYRRGPARVSALVFLTAPFESPLRTFYGRDFHTFFRGIQVAIGVLPRPAILLWRTLFVDPRFTTRVAQLSRALGPGARVEDMAEYFRHLQGLDPLVMLKMAEAMRAHSARDVLPTVKPPALIIAAELDTFTPLALAEHMRRAIPHSEFHLVRGAAHGAVIERPAEIDGAVQDFLRRHLKPRAAKAASSRR